MVCIHLNPGLCCLDTPLLPNNHVSCVVCHLCTAADSEAQGDIMSHTKDALHHTPSVYDGSTLCGRELARWVTPFRRRVGHWITDVTHLRGLITSER